MTNFIQPLYTMHTKTGGNQSSLYSRLPSTQNQNYSAFGRNTASTFEYKIIFPDAMQHRSNGFSNVRPTTITPAQNQITGQRLYDSTKESDPRVNNKKDKAWDLSNMNIQQTFFTNPSGALIAVGALVLFVLFVSRKR